MNKFALLTTRKFFLFLFVFLITHSPNHLITESPTYPITYLYAVENLNLTETKLTTIPEDYFSPAGEVSKIVFSANGQKVAYSVKKGDKEFVVINNKAGKPYDKVAKEQPFILLSSDGQKVAYQARRGEKEYLVLDGKESKPYDDVSPSAFSPDGNLIVSAVDEGRKWFILLNNDKEITRYDYDNSGMYPVFSADSRLVFYILEYWGKGKQTIFATDVRTLEVKKARTYAWIGKITLSGNSLRFAYPVKKEKVGKVSLVLNDLALPEEKECPPYDRIGYSALSPDGQRVAYVAGKDLPAEALAQAGGKQFLVVSNWDSPTEVKENGPYDLVGQPVFSPDGSLITYPASKDGRCFVVSGVSDGSLPYYEGKGYDWIEQPVFSPDGKKIVYPAVKDGKWCVVVSPAGEPGNVKEGPAYDMVVTPVFSPEGKYVVYRARRFGSSPQGEKAERFIVIADANTGAVIKEGPVCDEIWQPVLSADGKFVCHGARIGRELWWKIADLR